MSNRDKIVELLKIIPDYKIGYALAYIQGLAADEVCASDGAWDS